MNRDLTAEFYLSTSSLPLVDLVEELPDARVSLDEILLPDEGYMVCLCWIERTSGALSDSAVEGTLDTNPSIDAWARLETTPTRRFYRIQLSAADSVVPIESEFIEKGVTPVDAEIERDGWRVRARFPDRSTLSNYCNACHQHGIGFELEQLFEPRARGGNADLSFDGLTAKQREAVKLAYDEGYYELPREAKLTDLSDHLGISRRSLSDRLRRAERQLVETAIRNERLLPRHPAQNEKP